MTGSGPGAIKGVESCAKADAYTIYATALTGNCSRCELFEQIIQQIQA